MWFIAVPAKLVVDLWQVAQSAVGRDVPRHLRHRRDACEGDAGRARRVTSRAAAGDAAVVHHAGLERRRVGVARRARLRRRNVVRRAWRRPTLNDVVDVWQVAQSPVTGWLGFCAASVASRSSRRTRSCRLRDTWRTPCRSRRRGSSGCRQSSPSYDSVARRGRRDVSLRSASYAVAVVATGAGAGRHAGVIERRRSPAGGAVAAVARRRRHHVRRRLARGDRPVVAGRAGAGANAAVIERRPGPGHGAVAGIARLRRHDVRQRLARAPWSRCGRTRRSPATRRCDRTACR